MPWKLVQVSLLGAVLSMAIGVAEPIRASDCSPGQADLDLDGVVDPCDNCPPSLCTEPLDCANPAVGSFDPNTMTTTGGQLDSDADGLGDVCDLDLPAWEVSAGNTQVSCPECPLECAGLGCPGSRAAHYPVGVVSHLGLVRACDTSVPGFADGEVTPGCHRVCDLDGNPASPDEWCRKLDVTVWYPATGGTPVGPSYSVCETGGTKDSCEALGCVWSNDYFPGYFGGPLDLRCLAAEAAVNAPLVSEASDRPLPVLFLSHGGPAGPRDHGHLAAKLAESGYVVVSVSHPGGQWFDYGSYSGYPFSEGSSYQGLFAWVHSFMPEIPLLEQNPYCNATTAAIVQQYAPGWGHPNADNFSGFATKEECFANSCGVWDDATGCDADPGTLTGPAAMLLRRERGRDLSDVMTYFFSGELFDGQGLRSAPPPGGGWNQSGQWPWADAWDSRTGVLDPGGIGVIGHSFGGLTAITLTSKASYSGYQPAGTPDWDSQRFRDARVRAALLWAPGMLLGVPRVLAPLAVPTMIQSGVYDFMVPWSDDLPGLSDCVPPDVSGTGAEDPLCSIEGLFAAAQFDAPELEAQGLVSEPADPPRFLTRLDTAGHVTFSDEEVAAFQISCPDDPTQPCRCVDAASEASLGVAECTQLAGDRAKAEEILLENALSFLNAFVAENPSGWTALEGDQYASGEISGFLTADWDRDALACGVSPLLGDGVLDSLDPEPLVCNLTLDVSIDIKPWSDPNTINPFSRGVVPVALLGSDTFDVADADVTTLAFGPDGAAPAFDLTNPLVYWLSHRDVNGDGRKDLLSSYRTAETGIAMGDTEACLTGETLNGGVFEGCDAVSTVMPPWSCGFGAELALLLPPVMWLFRKRRY
jgi:hypothetical protein